MGVSAFFFLPVLVAALTSVDEFHSVTNTRWPSAISHFASNPSCVVFPEPSIPSTTNSFPGYSCGFVRLFNIGLFADFDAQRLPEHALERRQVTHRRPELEFGVACRPQLEQDVIAAIVQLDADDGLRMTAIEVFCQAQHCRKRPDGAPPFAFEISEALVPAIGNRAAVVPCDQRDDFDLFGLEATQIAVANQIVRVLV